MRARHIQVAYVRTSGEEVCDPVAWRQERVPVIGETIRLEGLEYVYWYDVLGVEWTIEARGTDDQLTKVEILVGEANRRVLREP